MTERFTFDEKGHVYTLDGKPLTGVTSVLRVISKPALIQWAANEAVQYIKENFDPALHVRLDALTGLLEEARLAHRKKKQDAGSKGTDVHAEIEKWIRHCIEKGDGKPLHTISKNKQIEKFVSWAFDKDVHFLSCEQQVYSEAHWVAGTYDFIVEIDGKKYVGDIKTSSGIYGREYFAQCAAYRLMLEEMGETGFAGSVIIRLGKDGTSEVVFSEEYDNDKKLFLACLEVYRTMGTFEIQEVKV